MNSSPPVLSAPPSLHTDEAVRAIGAPALQPDRPEEDVAEYWLGVWQMILAMLHFFGAPAVLFEQLIHRNPDRTLALNYLRTLESAIRRILLIMARDDARPLLPWLPGAARNAKPASSDAAARKRTPAGLPVRFRLIPPAIARAAVKRSRKPAPMLACLQGPLPPELDTPQTRRRERLLLADYRRDLKETRLWPVQGLAARFEALIRVYKDPAPFVMRLRQRLAAEQCRHAPVLCTRILREPLRLPPGMAETLASLFWPACAAARVLQQPGRAPPIAGVHG